MSDDLAAPICPLTLPLALSGPFCLLSELTLSLAFFATLHQLFSFHNKYTQVSSSLEKILSTQLLPCIPSLSSWVLFFVLPNCLK